MNRRPFLGLAAVSLAGSLVGCLDRDGRLAGGDDTSGDAFETELETIDWGDTTPADDEPPEIALDVANARVVVEGALMYSSSSCGEVALGETEYDADEDVFSVRIYGSFEQPSDADCTLDEVSQPYRLTVTFTDGFPGTVEVTEDGNTGTFVETKP